MSAPRAWPGLPRLALGAAVLAAERLHLIGYGPAAQDTTPRLDSTLAVAVGVAAQGADVARHTARRVADVTGATVRWADDVRRAVLPNRSPFTAAPFARAQGFVHDARVRGRGTISSSRAAAVNTIRDTVAEGVTWTETQLVPKMVDDLMPYLLDKVVPRLVEGALPEIRARVVPVVIEDLTNDPRLRALIDEQGRGVLTDAGDELRDTSATADDRVEESFRRMFHISSSGER